MNQNLNFAPAGQVENLFNQVDQQLANGRPATVLVERSNGDITTAQVAGVAEGNTHADAYFADITDGPKVGMSYKPVGHEKLTDKYQEHLAKELSGLALRGSGLEVTLATPASETVAERSGDKPADSLPKSQVDKYTEDFVKAHPYDVMFDPKLTDEQRREVIDRINRMDLRPEEEKRAAAEQLATEAFNRQRSAADHRYNQARQTGADDETADASANRAFNRTYDELLADELQKIGLK